jgi:hypothetical protein
LLPIQSQKAGGKIIYDEIIARDKTNLNVFWLKDKSLADLDNLPNPYILACEIIENLEPGLASFKKLWEQSMVLLKMKSEVI